MMKYTGSCHCGAIHVQLDTERHPRDQIIAECQCSFCRKHNARAFSDPDGYLTITARKPDEIHLYEFGLKTSKQVICRQCGIYVAMLLFADGEVRSVVNIDTFNERSLFIGKVEPRFFDSESKTDRLERRKSNWTPTTLVDWPM